MVVSPFATGALFVVAALVLLTRLHRARQHATQDTPPDPLPADPTLTAVADRIFLFSRDGVYLDVRTNDAQALYVPRERLLGRNIHDVLPPALAARFDIAFAQVFRTDDTVVIEYDFDVHGEPRHYEARLVRYGNEQILSIDRDVSDRKRIELALRQSEEELRASHLENEALIARLIVAREAERRRIARELHDGLGQRMCLLNIALDRAVASGAFGGEGQRELRSIAHDVGEIVSDVHELSHELHPSKLETLGLVASLGALCRETTHQHGVSVAFAESVSPAAFDTTVSLHLYRIAQEALHNIVKHSDARHAYVKLAMASGTLELCVADHGRGFEASGELRDGLGLVSMRERVRLLGGQFVVHSRPGAGTRLGVRVPVDSQRLHGAA
jgi:signal transduction histidine kinase